MHALLNKCSLDLNTETASGSLTLVGKLVRIEGFLLSKVFCSQAVFSFECRHGVILQVHNRYVHLQKVSEEGLRATGLCLCFLVCVDIRAAYLWLADL